MSVNVFEVIGRLTMEREAIREQYESEVLKLTATIKTLKRLKDGELTLEQIEVDDKSWKIVPTGAAS